MNLNSMHNFNRSEKVATLKLMIKIAGSDNTITDEEQKTVQEFLDFGHFKMSQNFVTKTLEENYNDIISVYTTKSNLTHAYAILKEYANRHGINPEFEGKALDEIKYSMENKKKEVKFSINKFIKVLFREFSFLWGKEDLNPNMKVNLAIIFTIVACLFGSYWTSGGFFGIGKKTVLVWPQYSAVLCGLVIYGAMSFRKYLSIPNNFRNIIFCIADIYLLSIVAMHILGRGSIEKSITVFVFFGLIILLWLGMRELLGFILLGFFFLLIVKIIVIDARMAGRAFPFMLCTFIGISFQSDNFFDEFQNISSSFFKKSAV